jgi:hypothetical protein
MREMWRRVVEPPAPESIDEIVVTGVAYDLPLPDGLFRK